MQKVRMLSIALAAAFTFAVAPVCDTGVMPDISNLGWSRSAFAEGNGVDYQIDLHYIPLMMRTEHYDVSDEKGDLLHSRSPGCIHGKGRKTVCRIKQKNGIRR